MIAVIIGHLSSIGVDFIFSWHMPLFFIVAGYFYHEKPISEMTVKDSRHLLIPYFLTCMVIVSCYAASSVIKGTDNVSRWIIASIYGNGSPNHSSMFLSDIPVIGAIWFLWAMFWVKGAFNMIYKYTRRQAVIVSLVISLAAILLDRYVVNLPLAILPGLSALAFYVIGFLLRVRGGFSTFHPAAALALIVVWILSFMSSTMSMVRCYYECYPLNMVGAIGGTYAVWKLSDMLSKFNNRIVLFLSWIGRNSLAILCIHLFDLDFSTRAMLHIPQALHIPYVLLLCLFGTYLMSKIPYTRKVYNLS